MNFACDHMLGTLARWLRFLGNDVAYPGPIEDDELKGIAAREDRVLLTRDKELSGRAPGSLYITSDDLDEQLLQVLRHFHLPGDLAMTRCSLCNTPLREVPKAEVEGKVPDGVFQRQDEFWRCDTCNRVYWRGTHWDNMGARQRDIRAKVGNPPA